MITMKKNILITGSTDGIGKLAAAKLAGEGHLTILHGRNPQKLSETLEEIKNLTKNDNVQGFVADFSEMESVREMAGMIINEFSKLDVLINNAGVYNSNESHNKDGIDMRFAVNYLAPVLLTRELMPLLEKAEEPRILNLSSAAQSSVSDKALEGDKDLSEGEGYAQSKLALTMWSFYLAKEFPRMSVIPVNPGSLQNTKMVREAFGTTWSAPDKGANILYELAVLENYRGMSGKYYDNDKGSFGQAHADAYNEEKINALIRTTNMLTDI